MLEILTRSEAPPTPGLTITLPFQDRQRSRMRVELSSGQLAMMLMPRGSVLRGGDTVLVSDGRVATIVAAPETVSVCKKPSLKRTLTR